MGCRVLRKKNFRIFKTFTFPKTTISILKATGILVFGPGVARRVLTYTVRVAICFSPASSQHATGLVGRLYPTSIPCVFQKCLPARQPCALAGVSAAVRWEFAFRRYCFNSLLVCAFWLCCFYPLGSWPSDR